MPFKDLGEGIPLKSVTQELGLTLEQVPQFRLKYLCSFEDAGPGAVCFTRKRAASRLPSELLLNGPLVILVPPGFDENTPKRAEDIFFLPVPDPFQAILRLIPLFFTAHPTSFGVSAKADIDPSARIGRNVRIGAFCSIGPLVEIGDDVTIHPSVTIYPGSKIGNGSIIHSGAIIREDCILGSHAVIQNGAIIGADGFGFLPDGQGGITTIPQIGTVETGTHVEIGANACVDRATLGKTKIGDSSKIDNLVQVGHNAQIGRSTIVCGQAGLAGSVKIGNNVIIGGGAGVADHAAIADRCRIAALSGVSTDLDRAGDYAGFPAIPANLWRRQAVFMARLAKESFRNRKKYRKTGGTDD